MCVAQVARVQLMGINFLKKRAEERFNVEYVPSFPALAIVCILCLYAPMAPLLFYSFNDSTLLTVWHGFSWQWYETAWNNERVQEVTFRSLGLAFQASLYSTILATMAALATTRVAKYRGQGTIYAVINQPLMVPEIVTAVALLILFGSIKVATGYQGSAYLVLAHTAFCIPFSYLPIRARLENMNLSLERAAADLYASPWRTFKKVTFPLLFPGILAGAMLAFVISLDDVVITEFVKTPGKDTLPTYMLGELRREVTPEISAISSVLFVVSIMLVGVTFLISKKK